jgi:GAF domain-containing protein
MEDYEDGLEESAPAPPQAPGGEALQSAVRPALVAATRLFLVAGVALVLVDETGELRGAVAAGDLAQALEDAAPQLWSGPSLEVLAGGEPVRTADLRGDGRWPALARLPALAGVNSLVCVPMEGPAGPSGTLTAVRRPGRPWLAQEVESLHAYAGVVASLVRTAADAERDAQIITQLEHALHHRVMIEQAKGILMEREQLDPAGAFDRLRKAARAGRRRVSEVAAEVVAGHPLPSSGPNGNGGHPPA